MVVVSRPRKLVRAGLLLLLLYTPRAMHARISSHHRMARTASIENEPDTFETAAVTSVRQLSSFSSAAVLTWCPIPFPFLSLSPARFSPPPPLPFHLFNSGVQCGAIQDSRHHEPNNVSQTDCQEGTPLVSAGWLLPEAGRKPCYLRHGKNHRQSRRKNWDRRRRAEVQ